MHVDHRIDPGSAERARGAARLADRLGLPFALRVVDARGGRYRRESPEAAARRLRYRELEAERAASGAGRILTAHHQDDQLETVLLQLLRGAPIDGIGGIPPARGPIRRPLLDVRRSTLRERLAGARLEPLADPTNDDPATPRNLLRHWLLPRLAGDHPELSKALLALSARSAAVRRTLAARFELEVGRASIEGQTASGRPVASRPRLTTSCRPDDRVDLRGETALLRRVAPALGMPALRWLLHERLAVERLPSLPSMRQFLMAIAASRASRLDLDAAARRLEFHPQSGLRLAARESSPPPFTYTFPIPGEKDLPEIGLRVRIRRAPVAAWMLRGDPWRTGLAAEAARATVRNRRPGDCLRPLGAPGARKLKELLIDRRIPAAERDRLPLVEFDGRLAWVPGVAIDEAFRISGESECWLAELEPLAEGPAERMVG